MPRLSASYGGPCVELIVHSLTHTHTLTQTHTHTHLKLTQTYTLLPCHTHSHTHMQKHTHTNRNYFQYFQPRPDWRQNFFRSKTAKMVSIIVGDQSFFLPGYHKELILRAVKFFDEKGFWKYFKFGYKFLSSSSTGQIHPSSPSSSCRWRLRSSTSSNSWSYGTLQKYYTEKCKEWWRRGMQPSY